jgi:hypothetical protein
MYQGTRWVLLKEKKTESKISRLGTFKVTISLLKALWERRNIHGIIPIDHDLGDHCLSVHDVLVVLFITFCSTYIRKSFHSGSGTNLWAFDLLSSRTTPGWLMVSP